LLREQGDSETGIGLLSKVVRFHTVVLLMVGAIVVVAIVYGLLMEAITLFSGT
jgi:hypothetical protein